MSQLSISKALETRLAAMSPAIATAWENVPYTPVLGTPFQAVNLLPAETQNNSFGATDTVATESGVFQVMLHYPVDAGKKALLERAELIRDWFERGLSLSQDGIIITINRTPSVGPAQPSDSWYRVPVSISYYAHVYR